MLLRHTSICRVGVTATLWSTTVIAILRDCQDDRLHYVWYIATCVTTLPLFTAKSHLLSCSASYEQHQAVLALMLASITSLCHRQHLMHVDCTSCAECTVFNFRG